jgi:hypothetical protein
MAAVIFITKLDQVASFVGTDISGNNLAVYLLSPLEPVANGGFYFLPTNNPSSARPACPNQNPA